MTATRPSGEQLRFESSQTGSHILDEYLEAMELGGRTVPALLSDIFNSEGVFRATYTVDLALNPDTYELMSRAAGSNDPYTAVAGYTLFRPRGIWAQGTLYNNLDVVTHNGTLYLCSARHTSTSSFDMSKFVFLFNQTPLDQAIAAANQVAIDAAAVATAVAIAEASADSAGQDATTATTAATSANASATSAANSAADALDAAGIAEDAAGAVTPVNTQIVDSATKTHPADADQLALVDSANGNTLTKLSWVNLKARLATYFGTLYATLAHTHAYTAITGRPTLGTSSPLDIATSDQFRNNTADKVLVTGQVWAAAAFVDLGSLTSTVNLDFHNFLNARGVLAGSIFLGQPLNHIEGKSGTIRLTQDGTGNRFISYNSSYFETANGDGLTLDTTPGAINLISYQCQPGGKTFLAVATGLAG